MAAYYYKMAAYYYKMTYVTITICFPGQQYSSVFGLSTGSLISRLYKTSDESEDLSQQKYIIESKYKYNKQKETMLFYFFYLL
jgi:hypothetical protein